MESIILICRAARSGSNGQRFRTDAGRIFLPAGSRPTANPLAQRLHFVYNEIQQKKDTADKRKGIPWRTDRNSRTAEIHRNGRLDKTHKGSRTAEPHRSGRTAEPHRNGRAAEPHRSSRTAEPHRSGRIAESHRNGRTDKAHRNSKPGNPNSPGSPSAPQEHRGFQSSC